MKLFLIILLVIASHEVRSQDSLPQRLSTKYLSQIRLKSEHYRTVLDRQSEKAIARLLRLESRMKKRLRRDRQRSFQEYFPDSLNSFKNNISKGVPTSASAGSLAGGQYLDSLSNSINFLNEHSELLEKSKTQISSTLKSVQQLQGRFKNAEEIKDYIQQRKEQLKEQLAGITGMDKYLKRYSKETYYYGARIREYQTLLQDKKKVEAKTIEALRKMPLYRDFLKKNSQLASLFNLANGYNDNRSVEGLQTRTLVEAMLQQRIGNTPDARQALSQQMDAAKEKFAELKKNFPDLDNAAEMPDFKPSSLKSKRIWQRLEWGSNIQFQKSSYYFPTTSDFAGQVAYKFHKNGSAGMGLTYKLGLGQDWSHIRFPHGGFGIRSFVDWRLKSTFFISGGYEANRFIIRSESTSFANWNGWQNSALLGISKKYKISSRLKGNVMVLYDFLAPRQLPRTDNIKVRIGYSL